MKRLTVIVVGAIAIASTLTACANDYETIPGIVTGHDAHCEEVDDDYDTVMVPGQMIGLPGGTFIPMAAEEYKPLNCNDDEEPVYVLNVREQELVQ